VREIEGIFLPDKDKAYLKHGHRFLLFILLVIFFFKTYLRRARIDSHRGPHKNGFDVFRSMIPTLTANPSAKISKATILIKVTDSPTKVSTINPLIYIVFFLLRPLKKTAICDCHAEVVRVNIM